MSSIASALIKMLVSILLLAVAFWPHYGAAYYIFRNFNDKPALWVVVIALWTGLLALNLPLSLNVFRRVTTVSIVAMFGSAIYSLWKAERFDIADWELWSITAIVMIGTLIGWWTVSVPLWRWYRSTFATEQDSDLSD